MDGLQRLWNKLSYKDCNINKTIILNLYKNNFTNYFLNHPFMQVEIILYIKILKYFK